VWNVQANIYFEVGEQDVVDSQALDSDYGPYIEVGGASDEYNNVKQFVTGGPPDVFFVWNAVWWDDNEQKYVDINGCADSHILLPDDNRVYDFAHEFGHVFGLSYPIFADYNTPGKENQLMYYASPPDGYKVMHYQVDVANTD